jgi:hypothetical protein
MAAIDGKGDCGHRRAVHQRHEPSRLEHLRQHLPSPEHPPFVAHLVCLDFQHHALTRASALERQHQAGPLLRTAPDD